MKTATCERVQNYVKIEMYECAHQSQLSHAQLTNIERQQQVNWSDTD